MNLTSRILALEARRPPATPPVISAAQWDKIARQLLVIYVRDGPEGFVTKLAPVVGAARAETMAEQMAAKLARLEG
jgi:hypothetical protein